MTDARTCATCRHFVKREDATTGWCCCPGDPNPPRVNPTDTCEMWERRNAEIRNT